MVPPVPSNPIKWRFIDDESEDLPKIPPSLDGCDCSGGLAAGAGGRGEVDAGTAPSVTGAAGATATVRSSVGVVISLATD